MKKFLLFGIGSLLLLLIVGVVIAIVSINAIAKKAVEEGGTYALGTKTTVSSVNVGLLSGKFALSNLNVANPGGFQSPHFMSLGSGGVAVSLSTLREPTVELPNFSLGDLDVHLEKRDGKTNYGVILDSVKRLSGSSDQPKPAAPADEKKFIIRELDILNVTIHADLVGGPAALGQLTRVTIPIDRIRLTDVGQTGEGVAGSGVSLSELSAIIVKAVLSAATEKGGGLLPADLLGDLQGQLAAIGDLGQFKTEVIASAKGKIEEVGKKVVDEGKKALDDVTDKGKKAVEDAADKLKGLIPGGDKK